MNENYIMVHGRKIELSQENINNGFKIKKTFLVIPKEFDISGNGTTTPEKCLEELKRQEGILKNAIEEIYNKIDELLKYIKFEQLNIYMELLGIDFSMENKYVKQLIEILIERNSVVAVTLENKIGIIKTHINYTQYAIDHYDIININWT